MDDDEMERKKEEYSRRINNKKEKELGISVTYIDQVTKKAVTCKVE